MAKRGCKDDAALCEVTEISLTNEKTTKDIQQMLKTNRFDTMLRRQIERTSALGTAAAYISMEGAEIYEDGMIKGGKPRINYLYANQYIPLTVVNGEVIEAAFCGKEKKKDKSEYKLVIFVLDESGKYHGLTYIIDENGNEKESTDITLGEVKPFSILTTAEVNNIDDMGDGYGLPKIWDSIAIFEGIDLAYNILFSDLDKGEKIILINDLLCKYGPNGEVTQSIENKKLFVLVGEKLPDDKNMIHEYNPELRIQSVRDIFEFLLSLVSMSFGFGSKKYTFENSQIQTATEYIGAKQDQMQDLNRQRYQLTEYIQGIIRAAEWFENQFNGAHYDLNEEITVDYDDSLVIDKETILERKRNDALSFDIPKLTIWYLMDAYNLTEEEATAMYNERDKPDEPDEDE